MFDIGNYDHVFGTYNTRYRTYLSNAHDLANKNRNWSFYCIVLYDLSVGHALQFDTNVASIF